MKSKYCHNKTGQCAILLELWGSNLCYSRPTTKTKIKVKLLVTSPEQTITNSRLVAVHGVHVWNIWTLPYLEWYVSSSTMMTPTLDKQKQHQWNHRPIWPITASCRLASKRNCSICAYRFLVFQTYSPLTHWGRDKMAANFQTTFSNGFFLMKMCD